MVTLQHVHENKTLVNIIVNVTTTQLVKIVKDVFHCSMIDHGDGLLDVLQTLAKVCHYFKDYIFVFPMMCAVYV